MVNPGYGFRGLSLIMGHRASVTCQRSRKKIVPTGTCSRKMIVAITPGRIMRGGSVITSYRTLLFIRNKRDKFLSRYIPAWRVYVHACHNSRRERASSDGISLENDASARGYLYIRRSGLRHANFQQAPGNKGSAVRPVDDSSVPRRLGERGVARFVSRVAWAPRKSTSPRNGLVKTMFLPGLRLATALETGRDGR